jgi:hypothetical protein
MFTIKVVKPSGEQQVYETDYCAYTPLDQSSVVEFRIPSGEKFLIDNADIYLMNANGKTVADYHVRPDTPPLSEGIPQ